MNKTTKAIIVLILSLAVAMSIAWLVHVALIGMWVDNAGALAWIMGIVMFALSLPIFHKYITIED